MAKDANMNIRHAGTTDTRRLVDLEGHYWRERQGMIAPKYRHTDGPMSEAEFLVRATNENYRTFMAEIGGTAVGYLVARATENTLPTGQKEWEGKVCDLFVLPDHRRRGVATALYAAARVWFAQRGCAC